MFDNMISNHNVRQLTCASGTRFGCCMIIWLVVIIIPSILIVIAYTSYKK
jgi:hypothetical protein